jgi:tRNA 2-thiouridine synthesizing protein A
MTPKTNAPQFQREVDARELKCPLPILRTKKALSDMHSGEVIKVLATDPGSVLDFELFAKQTDNPLVFQDHSEKEFIFYMRRR